MSDSTKTDRMIEELLKRAELARLQEATRRGNDNTAAYIFLSVILFIICAGIGGVLFVGPDKVLAMVRGTQQAGAPVVAPTALPIRSNSTSGNVGATRSNTSQQTTNIVQPTDVPLPAVDVQPAQAEMVVTDNGVQVVPTAQPVPTIDTAAILAQGNGPVNVTATPVPQGAYALAPDFAPLVLGQPTTKPTPASMFDWKK